MLRPAARSARDRAPRSRGASVLDDGGDRGRAPAVPTLPLHLSAAGTRCVRARRAVVRCAARAVGPVGVPHGGDPLSPNDAPGARRRSAGHESRRRAPVRCPVARSRDARGRGRDRERLGLLRPRVPRERPQRAPGSRGPGTAGVATPSAARCQAGHVDQPDPVDASRSRKAQGAGRTVHSGARSTPVATTLRRDATHGAPAR